MMNNNETMAQEMANLAASIEKAPKEKQEEIKHFLMGYTAALEALLPRQEAS